MHELGIVFHIIRSVEDVARQNNIHRVSSVTLELGEVSGILPDYLADCWRWACDKKDLMRGAELVVEGSRHHAVRGVRRRVRHRRARAHLPALRQRPHLPAPGQRDPDQGDRPPRTRNPSKAPAARRLA